MSSRVSAKSCVYDSMFCSLNWEKLAKYGDMPFQWYMFPQNTYDKGP